jgi:hypothetical protein
MNTLSVHTRPASHRIHGTLRLKKTASDATAQPIAHAAAHLDLTHDTKPNEVAEPALPHERDEQVGMTGGIASPVVQQGARDLERGIQDTSKSVEADVAYAKLKQS